jgi:Transposase DDE domain group 1
MSEHPPPQAAHWPEGAVFTLGHSTLPIERFIALLQTYGIERLVDIRTTANAVRLQLHALAYNLANFMRTLALPEAVKQWSLTSLREKLVKIGAKVVRTWPLRHLPDGRGRGAEDAVRRDPKNGPIYLKGPAGSKL